MPAPGFKLDRFSQNQWRLAIQELSVVMKKNNPEGVQNLVKLSARRFVKRIADLTPPAQGKADSSAKKRGESAILADLLKIAIPTVAVGPSRAAKETLANATSLLAAHARARKASRGRVNPRNRKEHLFVSQTIFNQTLRLLQHRVGWLAAGLNAAAEKLGARLPAWIKRHGQKYGAISVSTSKHGIRIRIVQNVPFADDVKLYPARWNDALYTEYRSIEIQAKIILEKAFYRAKARLAKR